MIEDEVTTGSVNLRPPHAHRGTREVAPYFSDCMVKNNSNNKRKKNKNNNNNNKKCTLIDVAIPSDKNAFTKVSETTFQV